MNPCMIIRIRYTGGTPRKIDRMDTKHGGPWTYGVRLGMNSLNFKAVTFLMIKHNWFKESETARSFKVLFLREIPSF